MRVAAIKRRRFYLISAAIAAIPSLAIAQTSYTWNGGSSDWNTPTKGTPNGIPGAPGDTVEITNSGTLALTVTYDYTGTSSFMNSVTLDATGRGPTTTLAMGAGTLTASVETVGSVGPAMVNQTGGANNLGASGTLSLGLVGDSETAGTYNLAGSASLEAGVEYVGGYGAGTFNQSGGTNNLGSTGILYLGYTRAIDSGLMNSYTLGGNGALAAGQEYIGYGMQSSNASDNFNQTGGTNTISASGGLWLASGNDAVANYNLSGTASLVSGAEYLDVGTLSQGVLTQTGGKNTVGTGGLYIGYGPSSPDLLPESFGEYEENPTSVLVAVNEYVGYRNEGVFYHLGGTNNATNLYLDGAGGLGFYDLANTAALTVTGTEAVGYAGSGSFSQVGGSNAAGTLLMAETAGTTADYALSGTGTLSTTSSEYVGVSGNGVFNQTGGTNTIGTAGLLVVGYNAGSAGTYSLGSGGLMVVNESIGSSGAGTFSQSGGNATVSGTLSIATNSGATGTYTFSGGQLTIGVLAVNTNGVFNATAGNFTFAALDQTGGTASLLGPLNPLVIDSPHTSILAGGSLLTDGEDIGLNAVGSFNQSGGTNSLGTAPLNVGAGLGMTCSYALSGTGTLLAEVVNIGSGSDSVGTFNQTGGINGMGNRSSLNVASGSDSTGTYSLSGTGILTMDNEDIGVEGVGYLNQSGGVNSAAVGIVVGSISGNAPGTYVLSAGSVTTPEVDVGEGGNGLFNQSGGSNTVTFGGTLFVGGGSSTGTYILAATGSLTAPVESIAPGGTGIFNQTGGSNAMGTAGNLYISDFSRGSTGTYLLSGTGTLLAGTEYVGGLGIGLFKQSGGTNTAAISLNMTGASQVTDSYSLSGGSLLSGTETIGTSGAAIFNQTAGTNSLSGTLAIGGDGQYLLAGGVLALSGNGSVAAGGTLTIQNSGELNLGQSALTFSYTAGNDPIVAIKDYLQTGYASGAWNGPGIDSSFVASHPGYGIGYADGADGVVAGLPSGEIEVLPTLVGDATLAGSVGFADFQIVQNNINLPGTWDQGNFLYGPTVDFADFAGLVANIPSAPLTMAQLSAMDSFAAEYGDTLTANANGTGFLIVPIPEPASAALAAAAGFGLMMRRRRGRS